MSNLVCAVDDHGHDAACCVRLSGDLSVSHATAVHQALLSAIDKHNQVDVVLQDVTAFDVSVMQILLAASKETTTAVQIRLGENSDCASHWLSIAGLSESFGLEPVHA